MSEEAHGTRLARMMMRANHRGIKEMDIILGRYAEARLDRMDAAALDLFDALLSENDQDLYQWVTGQSTPPARFSPLVDEIARVAYNGEYRKF